jgi:hypothetical protein
MISNYVAVNNATLSKSVSAAGEYLTLTQGNDVSGLDILKVQGIHV